MSDYQNWWKKYQVDVPEGTSGNWKIERFEVTEEQARISEIRSVFSNSDRGRAVSAGTYTRLMRGSDVIMSDTYAEIRDHIGFIQNASGRVLIHGLGLGMCARACLMKEDITSVTVVEISPDVINLVQPWLKKISAKYSTALIILQDDALTWKAAKGTKWNTIWHDIWNYICGDNWPEMKKLHHRFGKRCDWQDSWCRSRVRELNGSR